MDAKIKEMWLTALRSGEYKQGSSCLQNIDNEYCCLGVLCDLHSKITGNRWVDRFITRSYFGVGHCLPIEVITWSGLANHNPICNVGDESFSLSRWNDSGKSFSEIADIIESSL